MWKNLLALLELLTSATNRITRLEKDVEALEKDRRDQQKEIQAIWLQLGRLVERENWREEKLRQEKEIERLKRQLEGERQRPGLPPAPADDDDDAS